MALPKASLHRDGACRPRSRFAGGTQPGLRRRRLDLPRLGNLTKDLFGNCGASEHFHPVVGAVRVRSQDVFGRRGPLLLLRPGVPADHRSVGDETHPRRDDNLLAENIGPVLVGDVQTRDSLRQETRAHHRADGRPLCLDFERLESLLIDVLYGVVPGPFSVDRRMVRHDHDLID